MPIGAQGRPARLRPKSAICRELPRLSGPNSNRTPSACPSDGTDNRKVSICRAFQAADGTRTHDLLHGKKKLIRRCTPLLACKLPLFRPRGPRAEYPSIRADSGGFSEPFPNGAPIAGPSAYRAEGLRVDPLDIVVDTVDDGPALVETVTGWEGTTVPDALARRISKATPRTRVCQEVRLRLLRTLA
jgi:hypothetical protein